MAYQSNNKPSGYDRQGSTNSGWQASNAYAIAFKGTPTVKDDYVDEAEKVILAIKDDRNGRNLTTTKLRNLLSLTADLYNQAERCSQEDLPTEITGKIDYLRIRFAYEAGRTPEVKCLVETANLLEKLKSIQNKKTNFIRFSRYMEALVAFHRYHGGKD